MEYYVYIIGCADASFYVGHAHSVPKRYSRHLEGSGAIHTSAHTPEKIVYSEKFATKAEAVRRERQIKGWSRAKKLALIEGRVADLKELNPSRDHQPCD